MIPPAVALTVVKYVPETVDPVVTRLAPDNPMNDAPPAVIDNEPENDEESDIVTETEAMTVPIEAPGGSVGRGGVVPVSAGFGVTRTSIGIGPTGTLPPIRYSPCDSIACH